MEEFVALQLAHKKWSPEADKNIKYNQRTKRDHKFFPGEEKTSFVRRSLEERQRKP